MKITLTQTEIEQALKTYMQNVMSIRDDVQMKCEFTSTRGPMGILAEIDINLSSGSKCCEMCEPERKEKKVEMYEPEPEEKVENIIPQVEPEEEKEEEDIPQEGSVQSLFQNLT